MCVINNPTLDDKMSVSTLRLKSRLGQVAKGINSRIDLMRAYSKAHTALILEHRANRAKLKTTSTAAQISASLCESIQSNSNNISNIQTVVAIPVARASKCSSHQLLPT